MGKKEKKLQMSSVAEQMDATQFDDKIALPLVPALLKALGSVSNVNEGTNADFRFGGISLETHDFISSQLTDDLNICNSLKKKQGLKMSVLNNELT